MKNATVLLVSLAVPLAALLFASCPEPEPAMEPVPMPARTTPPDPAEPPDQPPDEPNVDPRALVQRSRDAMGTSFQISVASMSEAEAAPHIERALDEIERLEEVLSEWDRDSEIARINAAAGDGEAIAVSPDTLQVIAAGLDVSRWSDGAFDLSWAALRGLYLFQPRARQIPELADVRARLTHVDWQQIELDRDASSVRLNRRGMAIGTGGIAKGYALDRASAILREAGVENFMLFGGGQVQVYGQRGDRPWRVGIQHPRDAAVYIGFLEVTAGSISTSGDYEHGFLDERGVHWHHIIDLETGLPARRSIQVTLMAQHGVIADALSTAAFILGPEAAIAMLANVPGHPEAVIIGPDLRMHVTPGTREHLTMRVELDDEGRLPGSPEFH